MYAYANPYPGHAGRCFAMGSGRGRGHRGRRGRGQWGGGGYGPRARRGDVRTALLVLLGEEPRNGYQLMQEIENRSDGVWRPSPGSVYPALAQLEDEGLVTVGEGAGGRVYELTDAGREWLAERGEEAADPWDSVKADVGQGPGQLIRLVRDLATASAQVVHTGDEEQVARAREVLDAARRSIYRILAGDAPAEDEEEPRKER